MFSQSEESVQFETFFQEDETLNSIQEEFQEQVLLPDKQLEPFQDGEADIAADIELHSETEARLEQEVLTEIEEKTVNEADQQIDLSLIHI